MDNNCGAAASDVCMNGYIYLMCPTMMSALHTHSATSCDRVVIVYGACSLPLTQHALAAVIHQHRHNIQTIQTALGKWTTAHNPLVGTTVGRIRD